MAVVLELEKLLKACREAERSGCHWAWIADGGLAFGPEPGQARCTLDFASEQFSVGPKSLTGSRKLFGRHAEEPAQRASRSTHNRGGSFETAAEPVLGPAEGRTRGRLPQDDDVGSFDSGSKDPPRRGDTPPSDSVTVPAMREHATALVERQTGNFAFSLEGNIIPARSQKEVLLLALTALEQARPGTLERLSRDKKRTKRPVARTRELLYDKPGLAAKYAKQIEGGWWVATNNNYDEVQAVIRRAAFHAGLDVDVRRWT